jgi:uncharacterized protein YgfB (UPF0149 family)
MHAVLDLVLLHRELADCAKQAAAAEAELHAAMAAKLAPGDDAEAWLAGLGTAIAEAMAVAAELTERASRLRAAMAAAGSPPSRGGEIDAS